ncbi:MAG: hypothetical protein QW803_12590 [Candidatus Methanomethylicia archaeon]
MFFLDDDCVSNDGWWNKVLENHKVEGIWEINWDADEGRERFLKNTLKYIAKII